MTRIDYLMQDKKRVMQFMHMLYFRDFDCLHCPFDPDKGIFLGCDFSADEDSIECSFSKYLDVKDFLLEESPNKKSLTLKKQNSGYCHD